MSKDPVLSSALVLIGITMGVAVLKHVEQMLDPSGDVKTCDDSACPKGRISILREYGGKIRCFAIPSIVTQLALYVIHKQIFRIFRTLSSDYTHDQSLFRFHYYSGK